MSGVDCVLNFGYGYEYMGDDYELDGSNAALGLKAFYTQHLTFGYEHVDGIKNFIYNSISCHVSQLWVPSVDEERNVKWLVTVRRKAK